MRQIFVSAVLLLFAVSVRAGQPAEQPADHLVIEASGESNGKHIVLLSGDEEYRSEEALPMMAQVLANQGFKCTVLFSMSDDGKTVDPTKVGSLSNPSALDSADALILSLRFRNWSDEAFGKFEAALKRGVPIIALRTSTHAFNVPADSKWAKYSYNSAAATGWEKGFGRQVLGETWVNHHGKHKMEGTRSVVEKGQGKNPLLNGVGEIFGDTDVYGADPLKPSTILFRGQVTRSLKPDSPAVKGSKNKPMMPIAWTRVYNHEDGTQNKVFTTTLGSSTDLQDEDLRRLIVNATFATLGLEIPKKADVTIGSSYKPTMFGFNTFEKGKTPSYFLVKAPAAPGPERKAAVKNQPPAALEITPGSRIGIVGGGLASRMNLFHHFETELQARYPEHDLYIRNLGREGDTPAFRPHPSRKSHWVIPNGKELVKEEYRHGGGNGHYWTPDEWLTEHRIDTVLGVFGYSESFDGMGRIDGYKDELRAFITHSLAQPYSGNRPQLAIISPAAFEDLSASFDLPNGKAANRHLSAYTEAMREVCKEEGVLFVDAFSATKGLYDSNDSALTSNGHNLTDSGYAKLAPLLADALFGKASHQAANVTAIYQAVSDKNKMWLLDYKIPNGVHVHGRRYKPFGNENYPDELTKIRQMTEIRDQVIWAANRGEEFDLAAADAETITLKDIPTNSKRPNVYATGEEMVSKLKMAEGYKVELFADEKQFPDLANPSQMAFDNKGRLWVSCMPSYPHYRVGDPWPTDKIIIFEDTDGDGKADKQTNFLEDIHVPMGFEITEHGVYVSLSTDLVLFRDTDGDDKADWKQVVLSGFDDHDTHHAISSFCADPSGAFYMAEGVFLHTNVETPYGPIRGTNGGFYRFNPNRGKLERTAQYSIPNPWGIAFNDWGQNFFLHTSGPSFSWMQQGAVKPRYNVNLKAPDLLSSEKVRPTSGIEFVSSRHFPDEVQGDIILCNNIGFLGAKQHAVMPDGDSAGYKTKFRQNLFVSSDPYFRPVDLEFAPDGSLYFIDWSNVLIGHMQHSARDPKRDHQHGRIYRVTYPSRPLVEPAKVAGATIPELLENLKLPEIRTRYRSRRELRGRDSAAVGAAVKSWVASLDTADPRYDHHLLEALWVTWGINEIDLDVLQKAVAADDYRTRAAATRAVRYNAHRIPKAVNLLKAAAADSHAHVRHEAIIAASWMGKSNGLAIAAVFESTPVDSHSAEALKYAKAHLNGETAEEEEEVYDVPAHLSSADAEIKAQFVEGAALFNHGENCASCHQKTGEGLAAANFPPLDGSEWVTGDKERLIKLVLHGVMGEIGVKGKKYLGAMPGYAHRVSNDEIAAMLTYTRNAWSNKTGDAVTKEEVDKVLKETANQKSMYNAADLLKAHPAK